MAANIDQAILVVTLVSPRTFTQFIDRFLASAEAYNIPSVLVFNKIDLYNEQQTAEMDELIAVYEKIGYECVKTSTVQNIGIDRIEELTRGKLSLLAGRSIFIG